jgi:hypothetical protein
MSFFSRLRSLVTSQVYLLAYPLNIKLRLFTLYGSVVLRDVSEPERNRCLGMKSTLLRLLLRERHSGGITQTWFM